MEHSKLARPMGRNKRASDKPFVAPRSSIEQWLVEVWSKVLQLDSVGICDNFFELGGDSLQAQHCIHAIQERLGEVLYVTAFYEASSVEALAGYLTQHYARAIERTFGLAEIRASTSAAQREAIDEALIERFVRSLALPQPRQPWSTAGKENRIGRAVFILSPPRSGSTLLRVMMAGHTSLFAPPELELLLFSDLAQRRAVLSGSRSHALDGTVRALMALRNCDARRAREWMRGYEERGLAVKDLYALLQHECGSRTLVDKTPTYALSQDALRNAEAEFLEPFFIHLSRHPAHMMRSFEEVHLERVFWIVGGACETLGISPRQLAELIWMVSHNNILQFLQDVPASRHISIQFETLVQHPEPTLRRLCDALELSFQEDMLAPYADGSRKMTDGLHGADASRMFGDPRFFEHRDIDASVLARPAMEQAAQLSAMSFAMAARLGY